MENPAHRTDAQWLAELRAEGPEAACAEGDLRALVVRGLRRGLASKGVGQSAVEDFAHDAVLRILEQLGSFRGESRFSTWALSIAMRVAFTELRRRRWRDVPLDTVPERAEANGPPQAAISSPLSPERALARREIVSALERVVRDELTERQRTIVIAELRELPQAEIAARLGMNRNALYKLGHDARRALQRALEQAGFDHDSVRDAFEEP